MDQRLTEWYILSPVLLALCRLARGLAAGRHLFAINHRSGLHLHWPIAVGGGTRAEQIEIESGVRVSARSVGTSRSGQSNQILIKLHLETN